MGLKESTSVLEASADFLFSYFHHPPTYWDKLRDGEPLKQLLLGFRDRIRLIAPVSDNKVIMLMMAARLRRKMRGPWGRRRFLAM